MLDKKTQVLLKTINSQCKDDSYKVIDKSEFLKAYKKKNKVNEQVLSSMIKTLQKAELISVKYSDNQVYCLAVNTKGRNFFDNEYSHSKEVQKLRKIFFYYVILAGISAFLGTAAAIHFFL